MNKKVFRFFCIFLISVILSEITGCANANSHVHTYSDAWTSDENHHWHAATCDHTDQFSDKAVHIFGDYISNNDATTEKDGTKSRFCSICNYEDKITDVGSRIHVHTYSDAWTSDKNHHWHAATCQHENEKSNFESHKWNNGEITIPANCTTDGIKTFTCTVCSKTKTETITRAHS